MIKSFSPYINCLNSVKIACTNHFTTKTVNGLQECIESYYWVIPHPEKNDKYILSKIVTSIINTSTYLKYLFVSCKII